MRRALAVCAFAVLAMSSPVRAYRTGADLLDLDPPEPVTWQTLPVQVELSLSSGPVSVAILEGIVNAAMAKWNATRCGGPLLRVQDRVRNGAAPNDGANTVQWVTSGWSALAADDAAAVTDVQYDVVDGVYVIVEADIYLNGDTLEWNAAGLGPGGYALPTVMLHELGHVLGLAHSCELEGEPLCEASEQTAPIMHPAYQQGALNLEADDVDGLCSLYEAGEPRPAQPSEAGSGCSGSACDLDAGTGPELDAGDGDGDGDGDDDGDGDGDGDAPGDGDGDAPGDGDGDAPGDGDRDAGATFNGEVGDVCEEASECLGGYCVDGYAATPVCSRRCGDGTACPAGTACELIEDVSLCVPHAAEDSGGCSAAPGRRPRWPHGFALSAIALAMVFARCMARRGPNR